MWSKSMKLFLFLLLNFSCFGVEIVAHRGASYGAPENTLPSFKLAWQEDADWIEGDFFLTKDGEIVCTHDKTTKRFNKENLTIKNSTLKQLKKLDFGAWKNKKFKGTQIPTLKEVIKTIPVGRGIVIELKQGKEIVKPMVDILLSEKINLKHVTVICFYSEVIKETEKLLPQVRTQWLTSFKWDKKKKQMNPDMTSILKTLKECHADDLDCQANEDIITESFVEKLHENGHKLNVWTVNDIDKAIRLKELGVDYISTDYPGKLREALKVK